MLRLKFTKEADDTLSAYDAKLYRQIGRAICGLMTDPRLHDSRKLKGTDELWRIDVGEYRVVYAFDDVEVEIVVIDKRNDDNVYKKLRRLQR